MTATALLAHRDALLTGDAGVVETAIQHLLQPVGAALVEEAWCLQGQNRPCPAPPRCPRCEQAMRLVSANRPRHLTTVFGPDVCLRRPYYNCRQCRHGLAPADTAWNLGPGQLSPAMTQIVAEAGGRLAFAEAAGMLQRMLQVAVDDNTIERTTESMGLTVEARAAIRAESPAPQVPPDPGSDILLLSADGGRVHAGGEWREAKCALVAALGLQTQVDSETGRSRLVVGDKRYVATITDSQDFFSSRVRPLAEDFGLLHPRVSTLVVISDGGSWIEKGWRSLVLPHHVVLVDILDIHHLEEHLHACADAVFGEHTARAEAWARKRSKQVRTQGPSPLIRAVNALKPRSPAARDHVRRLRGYLQANSPRLDYPTYIAQGLPIGSGIVEAEVKTVVNQRAKRSGMRWSVPGAQAVIAFRALLLSGRDRLDRFWATHPQVDQPPITMIPGSGRAA